MGTSAGQSLSQGGAQGGPISLQGDALFNPQLRGQAASLMGQNATPPNSYVPPEQSELMRLIAEQEAADKAKQGVPAGAYNPKNPLDNRDPRGMALNGQLQAQQQAANTLDPASIQAIVAALQAAQGGR